jgi:hypothetical protein
MKTKINNQRFEQSESIFARNTPFAWTRTSFVRKQIKQDSND